MGRLVLPDDRRHRQGCLRAVGGCQRDPTSLRRSHGGQRSQRTSFGVGVAFAREWAENTAGAHARLDRMEHALRQLAESHLPSVAALVGPLLAARLCVEAHGRARLARLPSGTVRFSGPRRPSSTISRPEHRRPSTVTSSCIPGISRSPRWVRGKIARMLAGKISIAAKVDAFEG